MPNTTPFLRTHQSPRADPQSWEHSCRMIRYSLLVWGIHPRSGRLSRGCRRAEALLCQLHWQCIRGRVCPEISGSYRPNGGWIFSVNPAVGRIRVSRLFQTTVG